MPDVHTLWTIGHTNHTQEKLIELLAGQGIQVLADVRSIPNSRHIPQFNRKKLTEALAQHGITYVYLGNKLGGRPQDPAVYRFGRLPRDWQEVREQIDYQAVMQQPYYRQGLEELMALAKEQKTAVMCFEEDPQQCHRKWLVAAGLPSDWRVVHIRASGAAEPDPDHAAG